MRELPDTLFRLIVDRTGVPFVVVDLGGDIVYASRSVVTVLGWEPAELVGRNMVEFLAPHEVELATAALAEIDSIDRMGAGLPIVFSIADPTGAPRHIEAAALPLLDVGEGDLVALRLRSAAADHHLWAFVRALVEGVPLASVLAALTRSLAASMEAVATAVHHGFDAGRFAGVAGSRPETLALPLDAEPFVGAVDADDVVEVAPPAEIAALGAVTGWLVPVRSQRGPRPAVLSVWRAVPASPLLGHRRAFLQATDHIELALLQSAEHERLLYQAAHDPLTGVANRTTFDERLDAALRRGETNLAVAYCDLDGFKPINDRLGHHAGDAVLVEVANRIRSQLRAGDELARIGGDEFTVLLAGIRDAETAEAVARRVVEAVDQPMTVAGEKLEVGLSVGLALARPGRTADELVHDADLALYRAKQRGGRRVTVAPPRDR